MSIRYLRVFSMTKQTIGTLKDFPIGSVNQFDVNGVEVALVHTEDGFFAVDDVCTHAEVSLSEGQLNGCLLECPMHGAEFDVRTGEAKSLPATKPLTVYKVIIDGSDENAQLSIEVGK